MSDTSATALVILARYPEPGKTKTRLARAVGDEVFVAQLYHAFLTDLAQRFGEQEYAVHWAYTPRDVDYQSFVASLSPEHARTMRCFPQEGDDFAARLHNAFRWTYEHGFQRTILIGSDSPHISLGMINNASAALDAADVVLGPADDGGYYLIAMHEPHDVFRGIPMSTSVVTRETIRTAQQQGLQTQLIDSLYDIDELPDLLRLAQLLEEDHTHAPATAAYLLTRRSFYDDNAHTHFAALDLHRTDKPL